MANLLEGLLLEEGQSGAYIPNAHENIDNQILIDSIKFFILR